VITLSTIGATVIAS